MPKKEINDYTFYKISNVNGDVNLCYVGSTVNMKERTRSHKNNCNNPNMPKHNVKVYKTIREHGGWEEFKMIEIGSAEQLTQTQARIIEEKYRVELRAEMNSVRCYITKEEIIERDKITKHNYCENNKEIIAKKIKVYYQKNKETIAKKNKVYRENNKEVYREKNKVHYQNNKEAINEYSKVYRENNKDIINTYASTKITCECGCEIRRNHLARHRNTKKHIDLMNNKNNIHVIHNE